MPNGCEIKITIVIVSYNVKHFLSQCLDSVQRAKGSMNMEVIVVDNHSSDQSVEHIAHRYPWVTIIPSDKNLGFSKANNIAIAQAKGTYILLLNPDTIIAENVLQDAVTYMDANPGVGSCGVKMLRVDGVPAPESRRGTPTPMTSAYKILGLCRKYPKSRRFGRYYMGWLDWDKPAEIDVVSGAFCLLRRKTLDEVGTLDDTFFMYAEDTDLSYRIKKAGWHNVYLPLNILHYKGESTRKDTFNHVHTFHKAIRQFIKKHYADRSTLLYSLLIGAIYIKTAAALCKVMLQNIKQFCCTPPLPTMDKVFIYCGNGKLKTEFEQWAVHKGLQTVPSAKTKKADIYHVYLPQETTYAQILQSISAPNSDRYKLALYHADTKTLVTDRQIII